MDDLLKDNSSNTVVPPVTTPRAATQEEHHERMKDTLVTAVQAGKAEVTEEFRPLVCKPRQLESWRIFKIMSEFVEGFEILSKYGLAASFFGSARAGFGEEISKAATDLAGRLAKRGFAIITGGASGIMEAANKGAFEAGGASVGLNIRLSANQGLNTYLTDSMTFDHFFVRKTMLAFASEVYVFFPGGYGTLDEFFEIVTLVQTKKINPIPVVLYGREYWTPLIAEFENHLFKQYGAIDEADLKLYVLVDTVDEAFDYIVENVKC